MKTFVLICLLSIALPVLAQTKDEIALDLLWEADTYTPPFYRGKSLPAPQAAIRVTAQVTPSDQYPSLNFAWEKDFQAINSASGVGRNVLIFNAGPTGTHHLIKVTARDEQNNLLAASETVVAVGEPKAVIYEDTPLAGIAYDRALSKNFNLLKPEISLVVEPFFVSLPDFLARRLEYLWFLNEKRVLTDPANQPRITLLKPEGGSGTNLLTVEVNNRERILQRSRTGFSIDFYQSAFEF